MVIFSVFSDICDVSSARTSLNFEPLESLMIEICVVMNDLGFVYIEDMV